MPLTKVKSGGVSDSITLTSPDINAPDIDGGTIDNAVIGGSTAAAGSFTTITATGGSSSNWNTAYGWGDHSTQSYATQTYVGTEVSNLVDSSPAALDTLNELAAALGDDPNFATTVTNSIALKAPLASPSFTGNVGIGESSPDAKLHIRDATDGGSSSVTSAIQFSRRNGGSNDAAIKMQHDGSDGVSNLQFHFGGSERMRIDSDGATIYNGKELRVKRPNGSGDIRLFNTASYATLESTVDPIYIKSANAIRFDTGGNNQRMLLDTSGDLIKVGGVIKGERGTASAPAYSFSDDTDTGMFNIANADLGFAVGGSERMRITSSGLLEVQHDAYDGMQRSLTLSNPRNAAGSGDGTSIYFNNTGTSTIARSAYIGSVSETHYGQSNTLVFGTSSGGNAPTEVMRIDSSGRVTMPYQPTWGASSLSNTSASGGTTSAGTLVFSGVLNNNGNHYSNSTGLFTAPVAGQYFVTFSGLYDDSYNVTGAVYIRRNTANLYRGYHQNSGSSYLQISMSGVVECSAGDTISIYSSIAGWHIGGETSFSGFLIG